jgi:hypothetical protein
MTGTLALRSNLMRLICGGVALIGSQVGLAQSSFLPVATATSVEGTAYVVHADGRQGVLARGSALAVGDTLSTTRNSTVRLRFTDGGETALRPESRLTVQAYAFSSQTPQSDNLVLGLLKGGLRAITGAIGKRGNVDAYRLNINTVTVGIRGTDFTARVCDGDCSQPASATANMRPNSSAPVIARVLQSRGALTVEREARQIPVSDGAPLYATDRLTTAGGGYAVLAFRDDTRITLASGTQLALAQYHYDAAQPARGSMLFRLITGGLRVATGLVAKAAPGSVKFQTSTATVGIRGTVFDLACGKGGETEDPSPENVANQACDQSLFATTRMGEITLAGTDGREVAIPSGKSGLVPGAGGAARPLSVNPSFFNGIDIPAPESVPVNLEQQFGTASTPAGTNGFYLMVLEGKVVVAQAGQELQLDAGESAYAGQSMPPVRVSEPPPILDRDPALSNAAFNFNMCRR